MRLTTFLLPVLTACIPAFAQEGNNTEASEYVSTVTNALNDAGLTILAQAVNATAALPAGQRLFSLLEDGNYTVFAPSNEAFQELDVDPFDNISLIVEVLAYHIVPQDITNVTIEVLPNRTAFDPVRSRDAGFDLRVTTPLELSRPSEDSDDFVIWEEWGTNTTVSTQGPTSVENLQVYIIDRVLTIPTTVDEFFEDSDWTTFADLFDGLDIPSEGAITIFVPSNEAFEAISTELEGLDDDQVNAILRNHIVNGTVLSTDIDEEFTPLAGPAITISTNDTGTFVTSGDASAQIGSSNLRSEGGTVHIIDRVLVNESPEVNDPVTSTPTGPGPTPTNSEGSGGAETSAPPEEDNENPAGKLQLSLGATLGGVLVTIGAITGGGLLAI